MRKVIDLQMEFWKKDIANIEFDLQSRDEIPKLLMGLQYIYRTAPIREKVFEVLKCETAQKVQPAKETQGCFIISKRWKHCFSQRRWKQFMPVPLCVGLPVGAKRACPPGLWQRSRHHKSSCNFS